MTIKYDDETYITDDDLKVTNLGLWPKVDIKDEELKEIYLEKFGRTFLGGDDIISYIQSLVSKGKNFSEIGEKIKEAIKDPKNKDKEFKDVLFNKTASGIGKGHSLGGLSGVVLGISGTKMLDSGLTGLCASRSLTTSSRRKETGATEIVIPVSLQTNPKLLKEYMEISQKIFNLGEEFKKKFGKLDGVETFNKVIPYNNPNDLYIVLPLDTISTIVSEVRADKLNPNGQFIPREIHKLAEILGQQAKEAGQNIMFNQRIEVPRDTYFHYSVFKDPSLPNYALEMGQKLGMRIDPAVIECECSKDFTKGFRKSLEKLKERFEETRKITNPEELHQGSLECMYDLRNFVNEFNESVRVKVVDTLSWRVWSEQKRHATLRQNVESVYSAAERASEAMGELWPMIEVANSIDTIGGMFLECLEKNIVIDNRLKRKPEIMIPYLKSTAEQLRFYKKMIDNKFDQRDALYIVPKNIRLRTLEHYDLANLIDLELPLRLCNTCEPERQDISRKKRNAIAEHLPELNYFLSAKCGIGFCTEGDFCNQMTDMREYNVDLHKATKQAMLNKARSNL